ncbi:relaxase [Pedobacter frigidisoli]|uniref:Relaxase n=1 Tax=Pedobacter frigidisoli TaxID=2530455 RepID=A0A4R0NW09_9SPHI|nr:relaxase/mobilization nuclease domain-containing protein [Pedobacter frigidisoli]TCD05870.1 relaxase [Pedobacter frigidisoli]
MVARISSGKSIRGVLVYNEDKVEKGEAKVVLASGFATEIDRLNFHQKLFRFEQLTMLNSRSKVNAMHISLNFHADDKLDAGRMQEIASEYMEKIGMGEQPFIVYEHFDSAHPHLHIATVLIERDGKRINTEGIGRKLSEPARKELEIKYGLVKAEGRKLLNEPYLRVAEYGALPTKKQLNNITKAVMRDYAYTSFAEYRAVLAQFNVLVDRGFEDSVMFEKKGLVYSVADSSGNPVGVPFKASAFYRGATMRELEKRFEKNAELRLAHKQSLKERIDSVVNRYSAVRKETLVKELAREQVALVLRRNEAGLIYGLTFVDHKHRTVFNGSDLGKGYSAKVVTGMFSARDEPKVYSRKEVQSNYLDKDLGLGERRGKEEESLLDGLLEKAEYDDPTVIGKKRKRRPGEEQSQNF